MKGDLLGLVYQRVPQKLQPAFKRFYLAGKLTLFTARGGDLPARARVQLLYTSLRLAADRPPRHDLVVALPGGPVILGRESFGIDALTLAYVWVQHAFPMAGHGRVVVDLGAHKGYFSAWTLAQGAVHVYSYEPQSDNFDAMMRARMQNSRPGAWTCVQAAVGRAPGTAKLFVTEESWAHSLHGEMVDSISVEEVPMVTLHQVLSHATSHHPGVDVALKANVEGSAGDVLFPAGVEDLAPIVQVNLDHEPGSPYDISTLLAHLANAGLDDVHRVNRKLYMIRRRRPAGEDRSARIGGGRVHRKEPDPSPVVRD
jgi:FkbM family methyltransferase